MHHRFLLMSRSVKQTLDMCLEESGCLTVAAHSNAFTCLATWGKSESRGTSAGVDA